MVTWSLDQQLALAARQMKHGTLLLALPMFDIHCHCMVAANIRYCACCSEATNGAEVVARMLEHIARHKGYIPIPTPPEEEHGTANGFHSNGPPRGRAVARAGAGRLRDAIVFGYMMQRHRARGKVQTLKCSSALPLLPCRSMHRASLHSIRKPCMAVPCQSPRASTLNHSS